MNIKHSLLFFTFAFIVISSFAHAQQTENISQFDIEDAKTLENYDADFLKESMNLMILEYGNDTKKAIEAVMAEEPVIKKLFGNERVNIRIEDFGDYKIELNDGSLKSIGEGKNEKPTLEISTDFETVKNLAENKLDPFEALKNGNITYKGIGFFSSIKYKIIGFLATTIGPKVMEGS
ncbi:MAG: SCP2 sterol-binding domain-containing protein [Candidatus Aenigmarchaeota archaeon]|nr:SCP2 sterol-binding domain-containing protein [Candidatus Aenigmarchaeota archaeon]